MNKLCILVLAFIALAVSCVRSQTKLKEIEQAELSKGIVHDTAFLNICFSDSLQSFNSKLIALASENKIQVDSGNNIYYVFHADSVLKNFSVSVKPVFQSNKLSKLNFDFIPTTKSLWEKHYTTLSQVKEKLENKYGAYSFADTTSKIAGQPVSRYYWIHGNLEIYLVGQKLDAIQPEIISIRYSDTRQRKYK